MVIITNPLSRFHKTGRGLLLWADNGPFVYHANLVLKRLMKTELGGNTPGQNTLKAGNGLDKQTFDSSHLMMSGITKLYEGTTISYPLVGLGDLQVLAQSSDNHPVLCYATNQPHGKLDPSRGRIHVDCGFTRLWTEFSEAGTSRYISNVTIWLLGLDNMLSPQVNRDPATLTEAVLQETNTINVPTEISNREQGPLKYPGSSPLKSHSGSSKEQPLEQPEPSLLATSSATSSEQPEPSLPQEGSPQENPSTPEATSAPVSEEPSPECKGGEEPPKVPKYNELMKRFG